MKYYEIVIINEQTMQQPIAHAIFKTYEEAEAMFTTELFEEIAEDYRGNALFEIYFGIREVVITPDDIYYGDILKREPFSYLEVDAKKSLIDFDELWNQKRATQTYADLNLADDDFDFNQPLDESEQSEKSSSNSSQTFIDLSSTNDPKYEHLFDDFDF